MAFIYNHIVTKPYCRGQSAGNPLPFLRVIIMQKGRCDVLFKFTLLYTRWGSSETGRKKFTCHRPLPRLPQNDTEFGSFLAGLIDSDGHFNQIPQLVISFHANDFHLAYFIKSHIGYGQVRKVDHKNALVYICSHTLGLIRIAQLIHNQLRSDAKIQQYNQRLVILNSKVSCVSREKSSTTLNIDPNSVSNKGAHKSSSETNRVLRYIANTPLNLSATVASTQSILSSYWLAGFVAGDGSFQFKLIERPNSRPLPEVGVVLQIEQKEQLLLKQIQASLGGYIGYRKSQDIYYYSSVTFTNAAKWIHYLDHTHLIGIKMTQYVLWRRVCLLIQQRRHLTLEGMRIIRGIVARVSKLT